ncbi:AP2-like ethylene-responsive transcription factor At2g41710 [Papaver somniferum]|uniref:AP2-like ethylene-responsive transcription factor At2g41710 n=1 Tax=Papaver somniferum TaxID=3469 RepID=UPI000E7049FB|nr:AP2-like ethylene-responsive transcription factor At2g41710 [Papaver somniferum]
MATTSSSDLGSGLKAEGGEATETVPTTATIAMANNNYQKLLLYRGLKRSRKDRGCTAKERISKMPPCAAGKRSSIYRGVTRHRWTGRYEAHLWDKSTWNQNQNKKGKQVYLGAYDDEEAAARAYDLAALKYWGPGTLINFPVSDYSRDLDEMQNISREEYLASLRRKSSGFSRGMAKYRGLSRPCQSSRWESSLSQIGGLEQFSGSLHYGEGENAESEYPGRFCIERKVDLTGYIKWWGPNKTCRLSKSFDETKHGSLEDIGGGEWGLQPTEPYQMPRLGLSHGPAGKKKHQEVSSALNILSQSAAYKSLQEKASKQDNDENTNNENTNTEMPFRDPVPLESTSGDGVSGGGNERHLMRGATTLGMSWLPFQRTTLSPLRTPFLSAPLMTNYSTIDPLADPILWSSLVSHPTPGLSHTSAEEVTKTETSSSYNCFNQEEH